MSGNIDKGYLIASIAIMAGMTYLIGLFPWRCFEKRFPTGLSDPF